MGISSSADRGSEGGPGGRTVVVPPLVQQRVCCTCCAVSLLLYDPGSVPQQLQGFVTPQQWGAAAHAANNALMARHRMANGGCDVCIGGWCLTTCIGNAGWYIALGGVACCLGAYCFMGTGKKAVNEHLNDAVVATEASDQNETRTRPMLVIDLDRLAPSASVQPAMTTASFVTVGGTAAGGAIVSQPTTAAAGGAAGGYPPIAKAEIVQGMPMQATGTGPMQFQVVPVSAASGQQQQSMAVQQLNGQVILHQQVLGQPQAASRAISMPTATGQSLGGGYPPAINPVAAARAQAQARAQGGGRATVMSFPAGAAADMGMGMAAVPTPASASGNSGAVLVRPPPEYSSAVVSGVSAAPTTSFCETPTRNVRAAARAASEAASMSDDGGGGKQADPDSDSGDDKSDIDGALPPPLFTADSPPSSTASAEHSGEASPGPPPPAYS